MFEVAWLTIKLAGITTILLLILSTPLAWWLARGRSRWKAPIGALVALPIVLPPTVLGFYLLIALGPQSPLIALLHPFGVRTLAFTFEGLVIGSLIYSLPFAVQPLRNAFIGIGDEPLEAGFDDWHWSRAHLQNDVTVLYEGRRRDGTPFDLALKFDRQGRWHDVVQPPAARLPRTGWLVKRATRADAGHAPQVIKTWIDAPFYARSALATRLFGENVRAVHESLSLGRFRSPIVQSMLPYRMPRAFW